MNAWLTRLTLDTRHRPVQRMLYDGAAQHRYFMRLIDDDLGEQPRHSAGLLYRIEHTDATTSTILVQTRTPPLIERLPAGGLLSSQTRQLDSLLQALATNRHVKYRITANPTKRWGKSAGPKRRGKLHVLRGPDAEAWWHERAQKHGLRIHSVEWSPRPDIPIHHARHAVAQFDGTATIHDPHALQEAIKNGVGRARSYGCGLLSIALIGHQ